MGAEKEKINLNELQVVTDKVIHVYVHVCSHAHNKQLTESV